MDCPKKKKRQTANKKIIICPACSDVLPNETYLERHKAIHESDSEKIHICNFCFTGYCSYRSLRKHVRKHVMETTEIRNENSLQPEASKLKQKSDEPTILSTQPETSKPDRESSDPPILSTPPEASKPERESKESPVLITPPKASKLERESDEPPVLTTPKRPVKPLPAINLAKIITATSSTISASSEGLNYKAVTSVTSSNSASITFPLRISSIEQMLMIPAAEAPAAIPPRPREAPAGIETIKFSINKILGRDS